MSDSTARVLRLLELLQSAEVRTVTELSDRLDVNERTVRRYVQQLVELDIPVESLRGRYGGYRLARGFRMPPVILSDDEALATVLGLIRAQSSGDVSGLAAQTALSKLRRALPVAADRRVEALVATAIIDTEEAVDVPDAGIVLTVAEAIQRRQPLQLRYRNADRVPSYRIVHPFELVARSGRWYLRARDTTHAAERVFRVDRIATARVLPGTFTPRNRADNAAALVDALARADYPWRVVLRIDADVEHIRVHLPATLAALTPIADADASTWQRAEIRAKRLDWLPTVILALNCPVVVEEPDELHDLIRAAAAHLLRTVTGEATSDVSAVGPAGIEPTTSTV